MSSTEQSDEHPQPARPVEYSGADEQADHRLRSGFVPLITFVVIVAAAAVTAAVVFGGGGPTRSSPPTGTGLSHKSAGPPDGLVQQRSDPRPTGPKPNRPRPPRSRVVAGNPEPPDAKGQVKVGIVPLTVAPGWKVEQDGSYLFAESPRGDEAFEIVDMPVLAENTVNDVFDDLFSNDYYKTMTNFTSEAPVDLGLKGKFYQESAEVQYSGTVRMENGKEETETGSWVVLLNPQTADAAAAHFWTFGGPQVLKANDDDVRAMITSMLN